MMTCTDFQATLPDYLETHGLTSNQRAAADRHAARCAACSALAADLRAIATRANQLPSLAPSRDLWTRIEAAIESPVVVLPRRAEAPRSAPRRWGRFAAAASLLVAVTAGVTYTITSRSLEAPTVPAPTAASSAAVSAAGPATAPSSGPATVSPNVVAVSHPGASETFDREIASLRSLVDERRRDLDSATIAVVQKNLRLIDRAIAESKAALANDPASLFLNDRLTHAYETKLQVMRALATRPLRS